MSAPSEQLQIAEGEPDVFISNVEGTLDCNGRVTGSLATKVGMISCRAIWYHGYRTVILPNMPDPEFVDYAATIGREPRIIVPTGINPDEVSIYDGFEDPSFQQSVGPDTWSESYIGDKKLYEFVASQGGRYGGGDPGDTIALINNKANFTRLTGGTVDTPPGLLAHGLEEITNTTYSQLLRYGRVYVRHTRSGGGLGNRSFEFTDHMPTLQEIAAKLAGDQAAHWEQGSALVEQFVPLVGSPSVAIRAGRGMKYDAFQITHDTAYVGAWSPLPPQIWDPENVHSIGDRVARQLGQLGFWGWAGADLGVGPNGERYGFEINGRTIGSRHMIELGERLSGLPWSSWRNEGFTIRSIDHFVLRSPATFHQLKAELGKVCHLATLDNPYGAVISIPPTGDVAGIQVHGHGYDEAERLYRQIVSAIGHPTANQEDHPLLTNPLMSRNTS